MNVVLSLLALYAFFLGLREVFRQVAAITRWLIAVVRHDGP